MGPREHQDNMGTSPHLWFCAFETATLGPELHVSMVPRPHQLFFIAKLRFLVQNYKSLWVPDLTCCFVHEKHRD